MELKECKYRLPCGWCDKYNRRCECIEFEIAKLEYEKLHNEKSKECEHHWELTDHRGSRDIHIGEWTCPECGQTKTVINGATI